MSARAALWRSVVAGVATLALAGFLEGRWRGLPPARLGALNVAVLLAGVLGAVLVCQSRARRPAPLATGVAAGVVLYGLGISLIALDRSWVVLSVRPASLVHLGLLSLVSLLAVLGLRALLALVERALSAAVLRVAWGLMLAATAGMLGVAWLGGPPRPPALVDVSGQPPNLLLVTIETLRADHLSAYGYREHQTPGLDRLAREGARFDAAFATAPWTLPSLSSVMTGYYPSVLGVGKRAGLSPEIPTLATRLSGAGYDTQAFVTNVFLNRAYGLQHGFRGYTHLHDLGAFQDLEATPLYALAQKLRIAISGDDGGRLTDEAGRWLDGRRASAPPFFLWLHYFDPHQPYGKHAAGDLPCGALEAPEIGFRFGDVRRVRDGVRTLTAEERRHVVHLYDADVRFVDGAVGRLLDHLDRLGLGATTLVVVTADHGEEFWDHGGFEHGHALHPEVTRVPLVVRWPGRVAAGRVVAEPVSLLDLFPTLLEAAGTAAPRAEGRALPLASPPDATRAVLSENILYGTERKRLRSAGWALGYDPGSGAAESFDRRADPTEQRPLDASSSGLRTRLDTLLSENEALRAEVLPGSAGSAPLTPFQTEELRALGYVE